MKLTDQELLIEIKVLRYERDKARARCDRFTKILLGIHNLLYPPHINADDGRTIAFRPEGIDPHDLMQRLSDRIRAIPDELSKLNEQQYNHGKSKNQPTI